MGAGQSKSWSAMLEELVVDSPGPVNRQPHHVALSTDPRSPSDMIARTPISLDDSLTEGNFFDPRSPTIDFSRTPISGLVSADVVVTDLQDVALAVTEKQFNNTMREQLSFESSLDISGNRSLGTTPDRTMSGEESKASGSDGAIPKKSPKKNTTATKKKHKMLGLRKQKENMLALNKSYSDTELTSSTPQKLLPAGESKKSSFRRSNKLSRALNRSVFSSSGPRSPLLDLNVVMDNSPRSNNSQSLSGIRRSATTTPMSTSKKLMVKLKRASLSSSSSSSQYNNLSDKEN